MSENGTPVAAEPEAVEPEAVPVAEPEAAPEPEPAAQEAAEPPSAEPVATEAAEPPPAAPEPAPLSDVDAPEDEEDEPAVAVSRLPDLTEDSALDAALESLLLVVDAPAPEEVLADALDVSVARATQALNRLSAAYTEAGRGIDLRRVAEGWRFYTRDVHAPFVERLLLNGQRAKLTRAALETLAVIAYRQPVTRARVAAVRGVNVDGVIRSLLARGLIEETGADPDTNGLLYRTTELFLERLGLSSVKELPPLAPLLPEVDAIDDV